MQPDRHEPDEPDEPDHRESADERAWRAIVENYGPRVEVDDPPPAAPTAGPAPSDAPFGGRFGNLTGGVPTGGQPGSPGQADDDPLLAEDEGYDPPPPPPLPRVAPDRMLAWLGVFGSPAVLLLALVLSISVPSWLGYLLVAGFVGGFVYLVYTMPSGPRDPWDDGAQV